jgi:hypothetical protein
MENFSYHVPFYVVTGGVDQAGHSSELTSGQVGLFDRTTFSVATSTGNGKEFFFAQGSIGGKDWYGHPLTESHKSPFFYGSDVENIYLSLPQRIQNEEWVLGFNGSPTSKTLSFEKGKAIRVKLYFHGNPIYRFFGGPKEYVVSYTPEVECGEPCSADDCPEGIVDCLYHTQQLVNKINTHIELQKFGVQAKLVNAPFLAVTPNMEKYQVCVCDNGDALALQAVKAQYPDKKITRVSRTGSTSCYEFCQDDALSAPANFEQSGSVSLAVCGECPAGSTLANGKDVYYVNRPLAGTEDLSTANLRATYAAAVATAYFPAVTFNGATDVEVVAASDAITVTAHKFVTGEKVTYADGGGTQVVGLVDGTDYYVINATANTIKLATTAANALAGTAIAISDGVGAAHTLTPVITSTFISQSGATAMIKLEVPTGAVVTTLLSDTVDFAFSEGLTCEFAAGASVAWVLSGTGISSERTMRINALNRPDCDEDGDRLDDLTAILAGVEGIQIGTLTKIAGVACVDDYTVVQSSIDCLPEDCLTNNVTFTYDDLPAFENKAWEVVPETIVEDDTRKCGIRITAGYIDPKFGNCSFDIEDFYETMPIKMEVSLLQEDGDNCDFASLPSVHQSRIGRIARQSGEYVVRESIMKTDAYLKHMKQFDREPRMREAFDQNLLNMVDRNAFYKLYYVTFKASYGNGFFRKNEQEKFTAVFAFKEGDTSAATFESQILDVLTAKSGVPMHISE